MASEAQKRMANSREVSEFLAQIDSIQSKFMQSLITGRRDPIFEEKKQSQPPTEERANLDCGGSNRLSDSV